MHQIFDLALYTERLRRAHEPFLLEAMAAIAAERLGDIHRQFGAVTILSPLPHPLVSHPKCSRLTCLQVRGDVLPLAANSLDAVVLLGQLQHANDVPGVLAQAAQALTPDGLFLAVFLGGDTLHELREVMVEAELAVSGGAAMRIHPTIDLRDAGALLQRAGFALPVADHVPLTASYESATHLMRDLRAMGATNVLEKRTRTPLSRALLSHINALYAARYSDAEGRITASFDVIVMTGWKPHASQQQPSPRGSGKVSMTLLE